MMTEAQIRVTTNTYYAHFCGIDPSRLTGVQLVCTEDRNEQLRGFGCRYTIFALVRNNSCVIAYAPQYAAFFDRLKDRSLDDILTELRRAFPIKPMQLMIFRQELVHDYGCARILQASDYPSYEAFFRKTVPSADPTGWLQDYFVQKASKGYFAGWFQNDALVSVCDAPDMPFMTDAIQHTGIITLESERRKGFARATAALAAHHLIQNDICPQWECRAENTASIALAESIGYEKYGMAYILEE